MKVTAVNHGLELAQDFGEPRGEGIHISDLYNHWYAAREPKRYGKEGRKPVELWELGMSWEEILEAGLKQRGTWTAAAKTKSGIDWSRPGELTTAEGFLYNPDLYAFHRGRDTGGEIKLTFMSARGIPWKPGQVIDGLPSKFDKYVTQTQIYGHHMGVARWWLFVFFVNEAVPWSKAPEKALRCWQLDHSKAEMALEWKLCLDHARRHKLV